MNKTILKITSILIPAIMMYSHRNNFVLINNAIGHTGLKKVTEGIGIDSPFVILTSDGMYMFDYIGAISVIVPIITCITLAIFINTYKGTEDEGTPPPRNKNENKENKKEKSKG